MRSPGILAAIAALLMAVACDVGAEKITIDPNQGAKDEAQLPTTDARLQQKVTYTAKRTALKVILADLSRMTGVILKAGYNNDDWQVRDRKMNVFAKDLPLAALMNSIARVMKFKWSKRDDVSPPQYRLYLDRKTLLAANAARSRAEAEFTEFALKQRAKYYDYIMNCKEPSPAEMETLRDEQPYLYLLHKKGTARLLRALFNEVPGFSAAFLTGDRHLNPPVSILSNETQQMLLSRVQQEWAAANRKPFPQSATDHFDRARLRLEVWMPDDFYQNDSRDSWFGNTLLLCDQLVFGFDQMNDPANPQVQERSREELITLETDSDRGRVAGEREQQSVEAHRKALDEKNKHFPPELAPEHPDEPDLHKKVTLKPSGEPRTITYWRSEAGKRFTELLESLSNASGLSVVSDSFLLMRDVADNTSVYDSEKELKDILDAVAEGYVCNWEKHGSVLEFRDKYWFRKRTTQIPDEWVQAWWRSFKRNGFLTLDDMAQMAALTKEQRRENLDANEEFDIPGKDDWPGGLFWALEHSHHVFRFYRSLEPSQRKMFLSSDGLDVEFLSAPQRELALNIYYRPEDAEWEAASIWDGPNPPVRLRASLRDFNEKEMGYAVIAAAENNAHLREWRVSSPKYVEPTQAGVAGANSQTTNTEPKKSR